MQKLQKCAFIIHFRPYYCLIIEKYTFLNHLCATKEKMIKPQVNIPISNATSYIKYDINNAVG